MATYNGAKYIREQIDSILGQTVQDFELIISDDCSTDDTFAIVNEYCMKDSRLRIYKNTTNIGYRRNFENLVPKCKGDYVAFCDQDDIWLPNHLEILYNNIGDYDVCTADSEIIDANGCRLGFKSSDYNRLKHFPTKPLEQSYVYMYWHNPFAGCNTLYRKSFLDRILPIGDYKINLHDTYIDTMACLIGNGIKYIEDVILLYRFHTDSVTYTSKKHYQSPFKCIVRKTITPYGKRKTRYVVDRIAYCEKIYSMNLNLSKEQQMVINNAYRYHCRRHCIIGRIQNLFFDLKNFRLIYTR